MSWGLQQIRNGFFAQDEYNKKLVIFTKVLIIKNKMMFQFLGKDLFPTIKT